MDTSIPGSDFIREGSIVTSSSHLRKPKLTQDKSLAQDHTVNKRLLVQVWPMPLSPHPRCCHYYNGTDSPCGWASFTWDHLPRGEQWGCHTSPLRKPPVAPWAVWTKACSDTNISHSLLRKAETGQASRRFIRGASGHIKTVIKQKLKTVSVGKAQDRSCLCLCRLLEKGRRAGARRDKDGNRWDGDAM